MEGEGRGIKEGVGREDERAQIAVNATMKHNCCNVRENRKIRTSAKRGLSGRDGTGGRGKVQGEWGR